jgi:hypothetical protein
MFLSRKLLSRDYIIIHVDHHQKYNFIIIFKFRVEFSIEGNSATHGGHQDAQS